MKVHSLHTWNVSPDKAIALQNKLAEQVQEVPLDIHEVRYIAGIDVSSQKYSPILTAGVVVWDMKKQKIVESVSAQDTETMPYIPGLLSFREIPVIAQAAQKLKTIPDVCFVDGHGIAHPRGLGIAAHFGLLVSIPTIGVAKKLLAGSARKPGMQKGSISPIVYKDKPLGMAVRTKHKVAPVYISIGNRIDLGSAVELVLEASCGYRLPEPTRLAHNYVNEVLRSSLTQTK